jgi:hypothetical protein
MGLPIVRFQRFANGSTGRNGLVHPGPVYPQKAETKDRQKGRFFARGRPQSDSGWFFVYLRRFTPPTGREIERQGESNRQPKARPSTSGACGD